MARRKTVGNFTQLYFQMMSSEPELYPFISSLNAFNVNRVFFFSVVKGTVCGQTLKELVTFTSVYLAQASQILWIV